MQWHAGGKGGRGFPLKKNLASPVKKLPLQKLRTLGNTLFCALPAHFNQIYQ